MYFKISRIHNYLHIIELYLTCTREVHVLYLLRYFASMCLQMQLLKTQNSFEKEPSIEKERERRSLSKSKEDEKTARYKDERSSTKDDVNFLMQVK